MCAARLGSNNHPLADLPQYRWIELFRFAGYPHEYEPATRPIGRAVRPRSTSSTRSVSLPSRSADPAGNLRPPQPGST